MTRPTCPHTEETSYSHVIGYIKQDVGNLTKNQGRTPKGVPGENHRPTVSHWTTLSHNVVHFEFALSRSRTHNFSGDISTDCIDICKFKNHTITNTYKIVFQPIMNTYIVVPFTNIIIDLTSMLFANKISKLFIFFFPWPVKTLPN
jgi:hypothetical protein